MRNRKNKPEHEPSRPRTSDPIVRKDLEDAASGKDLSYLNEIPQMGGYEGVKAGVPPAKENNKRVERKSLADES